MQLQDEEGPPEPGRRSPPLIAGPCATCKTLDMTATEAQRDGGRRRSHLDAGDGETAAPTGTFA